MILKSSVITLIQIFKKTNNKSRMLVGYCWEWKKARRNKTDIPDIVIGGFGMSWNLGASKTWTIDNHSINEIGCIHTCQRLEFEYVGYYYRFF